MTEVVNAPTRGIDLTLACRIVDRALAIARERSLRPMSIAVLDHAGDLVVFKRENGTGIRRQAIVLAKATCALIMNRSSRAVGEIGSRDPLFVQSLMAATGGHMVPTPGGVLIIGKDGIILGAVGSSGDHPDEDERCVIKAINENGLNSEPPCPAN